MAEGAAPLNVGQLVADYHQPLYRYAFRLAGSVADAEDLTQQVFLIAHQKVDQVRDAQSVRGWLFAVLRNCYLKTRRKRVPVPAATVELDINLVPDEVVKQEIDSEQLQAAIDSLDDDFKITLLLFYFEHRSYREIAETLEIPLGTVMSRLARAKARLRKQLCEPNEDRATQSDLNRAEGSAYASLRRSTTSKP